MDPQQPPQGQPPAQGDAPTQAERPPQQWQQPPSQPQWNPPPQQPMGWGGPGYAAPPPRPLGVTLASLYLIVAGILFLLSGACSAAFGGLFSGAGSQVTNQLPSGFLGLAAGFLFFVAILALIFGIAQIAAGAGAMAGRSWGRWTGIIFSIVLAFFLILIGVSGLGDNRSTGVAVAFLLAGVLYALSAWAFIQSGNWFAWRR